MRRLLMVMDYIDMQTGEESKKEIKQKGRKCSDKAQRDGHACQNGPHCCYVVPKCMLVRTPTEDWLNEMTGSELHKQKSTSERGGAVTPTLRDAARWARRRAL